MASVLMLIVSPLNSLDFPAHTFIRSLQENIQLRSFISLVEHLVLFIELTFLFSIQSHKHCKFKWRSTTIVNRRFEDCRNRNFEKIIVGHLKLFNIEWSSGLFYYFFKNMLENFNVVFLKESNLDMVILHRQGSNFIVKDFESCMLNHWPIQCSIMTGMIDFDPLRSCINSRLEILWYLFFFLYFFLEHWLIWRRRWRNFNHLFFFFFLYLNPDYWRWRISLINAQILFFLVLGLV